MTKYITQIKNPADANDPYLIKDLEPEIIGGKVVGKLYRDNVGGSGNFSISGNSGIIPNLTAGSYTVYIYARSTTQSYTFRFNFGSSITYDLSTTNGILSDTRTIAISGGTFSGSVIAPSSGVASGTILCVIMYDTNTTIPIKTVGNAAITNSYNDLNDKPSIPTPVYHIKPTADIIRQANSSLDSTTPFNNALSAYNAGRVVVLDTDNSGASYMNCNGKLDFGNSVYGLLFVDDLHTENIYDDDDGTIGMETYIVTSNGIVYSRANTMSLPTGTGTVTSVGLSNATNGGLTISGTPVTGSGTITVGHTNVLSSAQTTQAVYPIKIDKNGHISEYGTAVTIGDVTGPSSSTDNHIAVFNGTTGKIIKDSGFTIQTSVPTNALFTDEKVTSADNHYAPSTVSGQNKTATATGATATWSIDVVKAVTLNTDGKGHVTGISVTSGKIPANPNTNGVAYCNTSAATQAKIATMPGFTLTNGRSIILYLQNTNTSASATLNVNSTGAKTIKINGANTTTSNFTTGYWVCEYDNTNWNVSPLLSYNVTTQSGNLTVENNQYYTRDISANTTITVTPSSTLGAMCYILIHNGGSNAYTVTFSAVSDTTLIGSGTFNVPTGSYIEFSIITTVASSTSVLTYSSVMS